MQLDSSVIGPGVVIALIVGLLVFVVMSAIRHWTSVVRHELQPNGGKSVKDVVDETKRMQIEQSIQIARIGQQLTDHLEWAKDKDRENREDRRTIVQQAAEIALAAHDERGAIHRATLTALPTEDADG